MTQPPQYAEDSLAEIIAERPEASESSDNGSGAKSAAEGFVDWISDTEISGWVWLPENPTRRLTVEVRLSGDRVAEVNADTLRDDLEAAGIGDGRYAFSAKLPAPHGQIQDLLELDVVVPGVNFRFPGFPRYLPGKLPSIETATNSTGPDPATMTSYGELQELNAEETSEEDVIVADVALEDRDIPGEAQDIPEEAQDIPGEFFAPESDTEEASSREALTDLGAEQQEIDQDQPTQEASDVSGYIDLVSPTKIVGWAWRSSNPEERLDAEIIIDGVIFSTVALDRFRMDLVNAGVGDGQYGFELELPEDFKERPHLIDVVISGEKNFQFHDLPREVERSILSEDYYEGLVHAAGGRNIAGWVRRKNRLQSPVEIQLLAQDSVVGTATANQSVEESEPDSLGFSFDLSHLTIEELRKLDKGDLSVRIANANFALPVAAHCDLSAAIESIRSQRYVSNARSSGPLVIEGQVFDRLEPGAPVEIVARLEGTALLAATTSQGAAAEGDQDDLSHSYRLQLGADWMEHAPCKVRLSIDDRGVASGILTKSGAIYIESEDEFGFDDSSYEIFNARGEKVRAREKHDFDATFRELLQHLWSASTQGKQSVEDVGRNEGFENLSEDDLLFGLVDTELGCRVRGWAISPQRPLLPAGIEVFVDGERWWRGEAKRLWDFKLDAESFRLPVGFSVDMPISETGCSRWFVEVFVTRGESRVKLKSLLVDAASRYEGYVDYVRFLGGDDRVEISGWARDLAEPLAPVDIDILSDNRVLATVTSNRFREDLKFAGIGFGHHGFTVTLSARNVRPASISAVIAGTKIACKRLDVSAVLVDEEGNGSENAAVTPSPSKARPVEKDLAQFLPGEVQGFLDRSDINEVLGWARSPANPDHPIQIDLLIDNHLFASTFTSVFRKDLQEKFEDHGFHGFRFEFMPTYRPLAPINIRVVARNIKGELRNNQKTLPASTNGVIFNDDADLIAVRKEIYRAPQNVAGQAREQSPSCALIVLNRDGGHLLEDFFSSFYRFNSYSNFEILIVDHGSSDDSEEVCAAWKDKLNVRFFARGRNFTFSDSNNYGTRKTNAEYLFFVNNDITFSQDVIKNAVEMLGDTNIGILGIRLLDTPQGQDCFLPPLVQHLGVHYSVASKDRTIHPVETRYLPHFREVFNAPWKVPTVTGAFMACRRGDFEALGGFNEAFNYGYEDVDLCLGAIFQLGKEVVSANHLCAHHLRGYSRKKVIAKDALLGNRRVLEARYGYAGWRWQREQLLTRPSYWSSSAPRIAFAVTEASDTTAAGDYFTAKELAEEISKCVDATIVYLEKKHNWYDLNGIDILVVMLHDYDLSKITNAAPHLLKIGWARNWMEVWGAQALTYDVLWASSAKAADYLNRQLNMPVEVLPIATNASNFRAATPNEEFASDYCFTGSFWNAPRDIMFKLDPRALPFNFAVYGRGWDKVANFAPYYRGQLPYSRMAEVYASTKIVVDDANSVTKKWGSVNSRVFDALAAGALVITNGVEGSKTIFDGALPSYRTRHELEGLLWHYLENEDERRALVEKLRARVLAEHTYAHRARQAFEILKRTSATQMHIAVKIGAPNEKVREQWGDYHFALALKKSLMRLGHVVRIDCLDSWYTASGRDDVVLVLRGLSRYAPRADQINIAWVISHPDEISASEYETYDHVFVASDLFARELAPRVKVPVTTLLQCTDPELFNEDVEPPPETANILFVGNSRNVFRKIVKDAYSTGLDLSVYGGGWKGFLSDNCVKGEHISNAELASHYRYADVVLNDHWDDMRERGFVSNRLFDCVASGARVISDPVPGLQEIFGDVVLTYNSAEELPNLVEAVGMESEGRRKERQSQAENVRRDHNFDARAREILRVIDTLDETKRRGRATQH